MKFENLGTLAFSIISILHAVHAEHEHHNMHNHYPLKNTNITFEKGLTPHFIAWLNR